MSQPTKRILSKKGRPMTEKQQAARLENLRKGREKKMETAKHKKEAKVEEYELSSQYSDSSGDSDSDSDAFTISRKKKVIPKEKQKERRLVSRSGPIDNNNTLQKDMDHLKSIVEDLANLQKKQNKAVRKAKKETKKSGGTKIVVLPQQSSQATSANSSVMDALRKSLM